MYAYVTKYSSKKDYGTTRDWHSLYQFVKQGTVETVIFMQEYP